MIAIASFFVVLLVSLIVVRVAAVALTLTGMSAESARFQARSAWTGTGFTTRESESIVGHPLRRRIISTLMVLRGAGLVTAASALMAGFVTAEGVGDNLRRLLLVLAGLVVLWVLAKSRWLDKRMTRVIQWSLARFTDLDARDYLSLFRLARGYSVSELLVRHGDWLADRSLAELELPAEGVLVLGITRRDGAFIGAPRGPTIVQPGDRLVVYGKAELIADLDQRAADLAGQAQRYAAMRDHVKQGTERSPEDRQRAV